MSSRMTRPLYVLAHPADTMGCGYHRILRPIEILSKAGYINGRCEMSVTVDERLSAIAPDVIVWQRQHDPIQIAAMEKSRELSPKSFHVYEIDDCMSGVPDWSPHKPYVPYDIDRQQANAIKLCEAVTVTTPDMAEHIRSICDFDVDVRIVPNMLAREELARIDEIRGMIKPVSSGKVRIGWGGGHAHVRDLDLIIPALREFQSKVDWYFLGNKPECEIPVEFNIGVPPPEFLSTLAAARLDLIIAPLVDCKFNRCKSNLRLIEAGALGVPVIASPATPYKIKNPPVFYAETSEDWVRLISEFLANPARFHQKGEQHKQWMRRHYVMDDQLEERLSSWMPAARKPFVPARVNHASSVVLVCATGPGIVKSKYRVVRTLAEAFALPADVVYIRGGTTLADEQVDRLIRHLNEGDTASVCPMSNDGGGAGFPRVGEFTPVEAARFGKIDDLCKNLFGAVRAEVTNPAGPVVALSRRTMAFCGFPDTEAEDPEAALVEWGVMVASRGFLNVAVANTYVTTSASHNYADVQKLLMKCQHGFPIKQLSPDPMVDIRTELELAYHKENYEAPMPSTNATYAEWAALFNEVGPRDLAWMEANFPPVNIKHVTFPATLESLRDAEWVLFTAVGTVLSPAALYTFAKAIYDEALKLYPEDLCPVLFYADHDFLAPDGTYDRHDCKPVLVDRHLLYQRDYLTQVFAVHVPTLLPHDPEDLQVLLEPSLYGMVLDLINVVGEQRVVHIPRILAHLMPLQPAELLNYVAAKTAEASRRLSGTGSVVKIHGQFPFLGEITYQGACPSDEDLPKVSVIMLTGGKIEVISPGLDSLLKITDYPNMEVLVVEATKFNPICHEYLEDRASKDPRLQLWRYTKEYNWSAINNFAVKLSEGEFLLLINDDTRVPELSSHWLREMVGAALQPGVGAVGARLMYPWGTVQHVGVVSREGLCGHLFKGIPENQPGYNGLAVMSHQTTAVTGAVLLVRRTLFDEVGGLNEQLAHNFNDVAFCLDLHRKGYRNIVAARAVLHHLEGVSRTNPLTKEGTNLLVDEARLLGKLYPEPDPYWNPNLFFAHMQDGMLVVGLNCDMMSWPAAKWPHRDEFWEREIVLLVGDDGTGWIEEAQQGNILYFAMMQGFSLQLVRPPLGNVRPFDIREATVPKFVLDKLGVTKIIVRSILGGNLEVLPFLMKLGLEIEYRPITGEAACPRLDFKTVQRDGSPGDCNGGWNRGQCQSCLIDNGSSFGSVSVVGWRDQWARFFDKARFSVARDEQTAKALTDIYPSLAVEEPTEIYYGVDGGAAEAAGE